MSRATTQLDRYRAAADVAAKAWSLLEERKPGAEPLLREALKILEEPAPSWREVADRKNRKVLEGQA